MSDVAAILTGWYVGEKGGHALFSALARSADIDGCAKWRALAAIEAAVAVALESALVSRGVPVPVPVSCSIEERAKQRCDAIADRSWSETMQWLRDIAAVALVDMRREAALLPAGLAGIGELMVRHEVALIEFAELELSGRPGDSLLPIETFLDTMS